MHIAQKAAAALQVSSVAFSARCGALVHLAKMLEENGQYPADHDHVFVHESHAAKILQRRSAMSLSNFNAQNRLVAAGSYV